MEGAALYKHAGWWYVFGTYGNLGPTTRSAWGARARRARPFVDKGRTSRGTTQASAGTARACSSQDQGLQRPGHPHLWRRVIGTSSVTTGAPGTTINDMAVRELRFVDEKALQAGGARRASRGRRPGRCANPRRGPLERRQPRIARAGFDRIELTVERDCGDVRPVCPGAPNSARWQRSPRRRCGIAADDLRIAVSADPAGIRCSSPAASTGRPRRWCSCASGSTRPRS